ncbi:MAG: hypothetical protein D6734_04120 [Candidatus Schekmanbacteria bacterium]|nr:MAG: hypothetical protein D6734_04120 [Candidatus Schekmanbacteria bacterium]
MFNLKEDRREYVDVKKDNIDTANELRTKMFSIIDHSSKTTFNRKQVKIDKETENQLRALGYIN